MSDFKIFAEREESGWADPDIIANYVTKFGPVTDDAGRQMLSRFDVAGKTVLDLCCGQGNVTKMLVEAGAMATGLDFSANMLTRARDAVPQAAFVEADAANMPLQDNSFDFVVNNFGMMHLPDPAAVLREVSRVLRTGGTFAMATWEAPPRSPAFGTVFGAIKAHADFSKAPPQPDLFAFTDSTFAQETLAAAGLKMTGHDQVQCAWEVSEPGELFDIFLTATVGARMLITSQSEETKSTIRDNITEKVATSFADGDGFRVPVPICVVTATKP